MKKAEVAGAASVVLTVIAIVFLLAGPVYQTGGGSCSSGGSCVTYSGWKPLAWDSILLVPVTGAAAVLAGATLSRWTRLAVLLAWLGCLALTLITVLGVFSIGALLLPGDLAAGIALIWIRQTRREDATRA